METSQHECKDVTICALHGGTWGKGSVFGIAAKQITSTPSSCKSSYFIIISHGSGDKMGSSRCLELTDACVGSQTELESSHGPCTGLVPGLGRLPAGAGTVG